ncbi:hypothetical protein GHT06_010434 [Daphnia sinensis]|uniref:Ribosomal protein L7Ae/L30e/S12e/Gadd45 domain-containing protein n=1 Tax=Daphnia sinensis TaxID=1820382 RepID=A0AAD5PZ22_9CRUS|nr:hypothetical protein GHT06_010434 [Daphnia sinensis]
MEPKVSAPVLTAAQQKKSISGSSKIQKRKVLLNTLDSPLDLEWPRIGAEKEEEVKTLLTKYLSPVRANNVHASKETITAMSKEERIVWQKKEKEKAKEDVEKSKLKMSDLLIGFRDVVRAAGKGQTCIVFCEKTPDPPLLTRMLAPLCRNNGIPLFAIKNFSAAVKNLLNIPRCLTMALKLSAKETTSPLNDFYQKNMDIYKSCGLAVSQISFGTSTESNADVVVQLETNEENHNRREILSVTGSSEQFYLKKSDRGCRFIPGINKNPLRTNNQMDNTSSTAADYISLGVEPSPKLPATKILRPPKIKQIRPNENKQQKRAVKHTNSESAPKKKKI